MNWKNKVKTMLIAGFAMFMTACKKTAGEGPVERPQGVEAKGNVQDALFENTGNGDDVSEAQLKAIIDGQQGQEFSDNLRADLADAHIYMSKKGEDGKTLVLTSVDKVSYEENGHIVTEYKNPKYGPNEIKSKVEEINGMEVTHSEAIKYEADTLTAGINKESKDETVTHDVERVRQLLVAQEKLRGLKQGDAVSLGGMQAVVTKKGNKLGVEARQKQKVSARKRTLTLDYVRGKKIKEPE